MFSFLALAIYRANARRRCTALHQAMYASHQNAIATTGPQQHAQKRGTSSAKGKKVVRLLIYHLALHYSPFPYGTIWLLLCPLR